MPRLRYVDFLFADISLFFSLLSSFVAAYAAFDADIFFFFSFADLLRHFFYSFLRFRCFHYYFSLLADISPLRCY